MKKEKKSATNEREKRRTKKNRNFSKKSIETSHHSKKSLYQNQNYGVGYTKNVPARMFSTALATRKFFVVCRPMTGFSLRFGIVGFFGRTRGRTN